MSLLLLGVSAVRLGAQSDEGWLARCRDGGDGDRGVQRCEVRAVPIAHTRSLAVDGRENGSIDVRGWARDSVALVARVQVHAETDSDAAALARQVRLVADGGAIHAEGPRTDRRAWWSVSYRLTVPQHSDLALQTTNGSIAVDHVSGRMELRAENGAVSLDGVGGDVHARATNGALTVALEGSSWTGPGLDAETDNGAVSLSVPERYSAHSETGTVNGAIDVGFPLTVRGHCRARSWPSSDPGAHPCAP